MDIVFFVIFTSMLAVTVLVLFAFFPIRVSWFYQRRRYTKSSVQKNPRPRKTNAYTNYQVRDDDVFDDPEL